MSEIDEQMAEDFAFSIRAAMTRDNQVVDPAILARTLTHLGYQIIPPERKVMVELTPDQVKATLRAISIAQPIIKAHDAYITPPRGDHLRMLDAYGALMDAITPKDDADTTGE